MARVRVAALEPQVTQSTGQEGSTHWVSTEVRTEETKAQTMGLVLVLGTSSRQSRALPSSNTLCVMVTPSREEVPAVTMAVAGPLGALLAIAL